MKRRRSALVVLLSCCAAALALALLWEREREPAYQGRTLTEWLLYERPDSEPLNSPNQQAEAIRHMGSDAVPFLLEWIRYKPSPWRQRLFILLHRLTGRVRVKDWRLRREWAAWRAFDVLGPQASAAIPELTRLMNDPNSGLAIRQTAIYALGHMGDDALPSILAVLADPRHPNRTDAALIIGAMQGLGTNQTRAAVSAVAKCLKDPDEAVADAAAEALGDMETESATVVPILVDSLGDSRAGVRSSAAGALGQFAGQARSAAPALVRALGDPDAAVRDAATNALREITPELLKP